MTKKDDLIDYLDNLRIMLKNPNVSVIEAEDSVIPHYTEVMIGDKRIGNVVTSKEYNIKFVIRN